MSVEGRCWGAGSTTERGSGLGSGQRRGGAVSTCSKLREAQSLPASPCTPGKPSKLTCSPAGRIPSDGAQYKTHPPHFLRVQRAKT